MDSCEMTIEEIRTFNRFYTVNMGFLHSDYLDSAYSMAQMRILFELKTCGRCIQRDVAKTLGLDKSYLSRLVKGLENKGLVEKELSAEDRRATELILTARGRAETDRLIALTHRQLQSQINGLSLEEQARLCQALRTVREILSKEEQT